MLVFKRICFYILSFTWGCVLSVVGLVVVLILGLIKRKINVYHGRLYVVVGKNWGGLELGCFFICCENSKDSDYLRGHECGHGLQNVLFGPFTIFLVAIPSAVRYWYRELKYNRKGINPPTEYDSIWFEKQATKWGEKYINTDRA